MTVQIQILHVSDVIQEYPNPKLITRQRQLIKTFRTFGTHPDKGIDVIQKVLNLKSLQTLKTDENPPVFTYWITFLKSNVQQGTYGTESGPLTKR